MQKKKRESVCSLLLLERGRGERRVKVGARVTFWPCTGHWRSHAGTKLNKMELQSASFTDEPQLSLTLSRLRAKYTDSLKGTKETRTTNDSHGANMTPRKRRMTVWSFHAMILHAIRGKDKPTEDVTLVLSLRKPSAVNIYWTNYIYEWFTDTKT